MGADGKVEILVDSYKGGRFNRPNDVVCHSDGCLYFTDPGQAPRLSASARFRAPPARTTCGTAPPSIAWCPTAR